jgi:hypothetical protein
MTGSGNCEFLANRVRGMAYLAAIVHSKLLPFAEWKQHALIATLAATKSPALASGAFAFPDT